ncbi:MAG TPA: hypothetical protein VIU44_05810 [Gaiellaceae bacterium]
MPTTEDTRLELIAREAAGVQVQLLWNPEDDSLSVCITDLGQSEQKEIAVTADQALDAFRRPFAYSRAG